MHLSFLLWISLNGLLINQTYGAQFWPFCINSEDLCPNPYIEFWLYKKNCTEGPIKLDLRNISANLFEPRLPIRILIHGFHGDHNLTPNEEVRPVLLAFEDVHVISVDYGNLAYFPCYPWAVANAKIVAKCLARMIDDLVRSEIYRSEDIHLIGFSLGGQVAGLTANYVEFPLDHITALDVARPGFNTDNITEKLDPSDAKFVDVMHTDPIFYGMLAETGHVDFYVNLRNVFQPGCSYWRYGLRNCNHFRAALYYAESIITRNGFWSMYCQNWWAYIFDNCWAHGSRKVVPMGYFVPKTARGSYFVNTHAEYPYAQGIGVDVEGEVQDKLYDNSTLY